MKTQTTFFLCLLMIGSACTTSTSEEKNAVQTAVQHEETRQDFPTFIASLTPTDTMWMERGESKEKMIRYKEGVELQYSRNGDEYHMAVSLAQTNFQQGFQQMKGWFQSDDRLGHFLHKVFADSIPTAAWEQLIHDGEDEATIVVKTDTNGNMSSVFIDVNPTKNHYYLNISIDQAHFNVLWTVERDSIKNQF